MKDPVGFELLKALVGISRRSRAESHRYSRVGSAQLAPVTGNLENRSENQGISGLSYAEGARRAPAPQ